MLGYILITAAVLVGVVMGNSLSQISATFLKGLREWNTLQVLGVVTLIEMLTTFQELTGSLQRIMAAVRSVIADSRTLIALAPSMLGLFPVPGGAMLSAPLVNIYGKEIGLDADRRSAINLFFRHLWDLVFPFKSHLILAASILNIPIYTLIGWNLPVTLATAVVGFWYLIGRFPRPAMAPMPEPEKSEPGRPLWIEAAPMLLPLILGLGARIDFLYAMAIGMGFGLATQKVTRAQLRQILARGIRPKLLFILAAVMIFKTALEDSGLIAAISGAFSQYGVPIGLIAVMLPLIIGMMTGLEVAAVGIVYPLMMGLIPQGTPLIPYVMVMMIVNAIAQTYSPAHVCLIVGNEYFGCTSGRMIRMTLVPQLFRLVATLVFAWALWVYWS